MGVIISKLRGKPSTKELLEELEKEITELEEYKRSTEQQQKRVIGSLIFYSILLYIFCSAIFFLYYFPSSTKDRVIYSIPLLLFPFVLYFFKKFLYWYFAQKIKNNEETLIELRKKRRSLLEYAMETETYKTVKDLLEKFDPDYHKKIFESRPAIEAPPSPVSVKGSFSEMELRRRSPSAKGSPLPLPAPGQTLKINNLAVRSPVSPMPRPVLPRERTLVDRLVDYLVGDGPSNRYALICRQCQSHNGMALREEFEFIAFRCCYCFHWNPPRNQQLPAPRLPLPAPSSPIVTEPQTSVSELSSSSGEDTEIESLSGSDRPCAADSSIHSRSVESDHDEIQANLEEDKQHSSQIENELRRKDSLKEE